MIEVKLPEPVNQHEISCWVVDDGYAVVPKISRHRMLYSRSADQWQHFWDGVPQGLTDGRFRPLGMDWSKSYFTEIEAKRAALVALRGRIETMQADLGKIITVAAKLLIELGGNIP